MFSSSILRYRLDTPMPSCLAVSFLS
jgi:hypothetical protein